MRLKQYFNPDLRKAVELYHRAVSGMMPELISEPDEEWPDVPPWQPGLSGKKWIYPTGSYDLTFWVRKDDAHDTD